LKGCGVWKEKEERVRCENGPNKNNKGPRLFETTIEVKQHNNHQQLARKDLLYCKVVTLDTSHWLMLALKADLP
jgi:hypothetical protein